MEHFRVWQSLNAHNRPSDIALGLDWFMAKIGYFFKPKIKTVDLWESAAKVMLHEAEVAALSDLVFQEKISEMRSKFRL